MKSLSVVTAALVLSACASTTTPPPRAAQGGAPNASLRAFEAVCLKTAPSFDGAAAAASHHGIEAVEDLGFTRMGMSKDNSIGVQIKPGKECVITTPSQKAPRLSADFMRLVGQSAEGPAPARLPAKLKLAGGTYVFHHDRKGGEAFVMLRADD
jgi:hypothetical protein